MVSANLTSSIFFYAGGKDWRDLYMLILVCTPLSFMLSFVIPESPRYLYAKHKYGELRQLINKIAKWNGAKLPDNYEFEIVNHGVNESANSQISSINSENDNPDIKIISPSFDINQSKSGSILSYKPRRHFSIMEELKTSRHFQTY